MIREWTLREEVLAISHRWPLPLLAFLIGCLLGLGFSFAVPSPYRAEVSLSVAYNGDIIARNPDDYKNWQMGELEALILSRGVTSETLNRLRRRDQTWNDISVRQLEAMLHAYWRNAGKWRLVAENPDPERAVLIAQIWGDVAVEKIHLALFHARSVLEQEAEQRAIIRENLDKRSRIVELSEVKKGLESWQAGAAQARQDLPLEPLERWRLQYFAGKIASLDGAGSSLLDAAPPEDAPLQAYLPWVEQALVSLENEIAINQRESAALSARYEEVTLGLDASLKASNGLTASLSVDRLSNEVDSLQPLWNRTDIALVGGLLGLLAWVLIWLTLSFIRARK